MRPTLMWLLWDRVLIKVTLRLRTETRPVLKARRWLCESLHYKQGMGGVLPILIKSWLVSSNGGSTQTLPHKNLVTHTITHACTYASTPSQHNHQHSPGCPSLPWLCSSAGHMKVAWRPDSPSAPLHHIHRDTHALGSFARVWWSYCYLGRALEAMRPRSLMYKVIMRTMERETVVRIV